MKFHVWQFYSDAGSSDRDSYQQLEADSIDKVAKWAKGRFISPDEPSEDGDEELLILSITTHACEPDCGNEDCDNWITEGFQIEKVGEFTDFHAPVITI